jgi:very-short-patch-repair endonuclease
MDEPNPADWLAMVERQAGAVSRAQAIAQGLTEGSLRAHITAGRWQRAGTRVFYTFTGTPSWEARLWAAVLHCGEDSALSHETAAALWGLADPDPDAPIHVTTARSRLARPRADVVVHRPRRPVAAVRSPPRTDGGITVLDLLVGICFPDQALGLVARACQRGVTNPDQLTAAVARRPRQRWRRLVLESLADVRSGAHSVLELRYLRDVERAHGLPTGQRQRRAGPTFQDVHYDGFRTTVELDGKLGHADTAGRWRDMARDNAATLRGETTLRYGWADVTGRPCAVAAQVAAVLRAAGWRGTLRSCGNC